MQENDEKYELSNRDQFSMLYFAVTAYAMTLLTFLRCGMGRRGIDRAGLFALGIIILYAGHTRSAEMMTYFWAWLAAVFVQRLMCDRRQHSQYQGWPIFTWWLARDEMHARLGEAVLVFIVGTCLASWSEAVGRFVVWGSLALVIKYVIEAAYIAREGEAIDDARKELESRMWRMKQRR
jgi:hypothetical protein